MKNLLFALSLCLTAIACNSDYDTMKVVNPNYESKYLQKSPDPKFEFQKVNCFVFFGNTTEEIRASRKILAMKGLNTRVEQLPESPDWRQMDALIRKADLKNFDEHQINLFNQVAAISILRNHELLAEKDQKDLILEYTQKYVEAKGTSAGLLYYCIETLGDKLTFEQKATFIKTLAPNNIETTRQVERALSFMKLGNLNLKNSTSQADSLREVVKEKTKTDIEQEKMYLAKLQNLIAKD